MVNAFWFFAFQGSSPIQPVCSNAKTLDTCSRNRAYQFISTLFFSSKAVNMLAVYNLVGGAHGIYIVTIWWLWYVYCGVAVFAWKFKHLTTIHPPKTKYTICAIIEKRWARKMCSLHFSFVYLTYHCVYWVRKSQWSSTFADVLVGSYTVIFGLILTKNMWFRGEQSSKNRKLTHVCWTFTWWKMYALDSMDEMCLCVAQQYVFKMKNKNAQMRTLFLFFPLYSLYSYIFLLFLLLWHLLSCTINIYRWSGTFWKVHIRIEMHQVLVHFLFISIQKMNRNKFGWNIFIIFVLIQLMLNYSILIIILIFNL